MLNSPCSTSCSHSTSCGCQTGSCQCGCSGCGGCSNSTCGCSNSACGCGNSACGCSNSACGCSACSNWGGCGSCNSCGCQSWPCGGNVCFPQRPGRPPLPPGSILVPRVVASGRAWLRNTDVTLCADDLPDCARAPFTLVCAAASGPASWEFAEGDRGRVLVRVTIPLTLQVRACSGMVYCAHASITADVPVRLPFPPGGMQGAHVFIDPSVALACSPVSCDDACFDCVLDVLVDVYIVRWEPTGSDLTIPCRPDLPLNLPEPRRCR